MRTVSDRFRIAFFGPPAAGKSTVIAHLRAMNAETLEYLNLDDDVLALFSGRSLSGPLSDLMIDEAVGRLLSRVTVSSRAIVEFPYHDYIHLLKCNLLRLDEFDQIFVVSASLTTLIHRSRDRPSQVPDAYVRRCHEATIALIEHLRGLSVAWVLLDSEVLRPKVMAEFVEPCVIHR